MAEEQIEVVTPLGVFTGTTKPKSDVHAQGDWHMCVHLGITDGFGNIVEQFRGPACKLMRLVWDPMSVAGHITAVVSQPDEAFRPDILQQAIVTVIREAEEELGLTIEPDWFFTNRLRFIGITRTNTLTNQGYSDRWPDRTLSFNFLLVARGIKLSAFRLEAGKVLNVRWRHADHLERVLRGESDERYADRQPDQAWLLSSYIDALRRVAQGY